MLHLFNATVSYIGFYVGFCRRVQRLLVAKATHQRSESNCGAAILGDARRFVQPRIQSVAMFLAALALFGVLNSFTIVEAQTPGQIFQPVSGAGQRILDPNGDGFVSVSNTGFANTSIDYGSDSEIRYHKLPVLYYEVKDDPRTGSLHTDLIGIDVSGYIDPGAFVYNDGTNLLFRQRILDYSTASKGYGFLFDTTGDGKADYEIVLRTGGGEAGITIYNGSGVQMGSRIPLSDNFQKSVAALVNTGSANEQSYYYDYFIPWTQMPFTASTSFRGIAYTLTSAVGGYLSGGTIADIGGLDDRLFPNQDLAVIFAINAQPFTSGNNLAAGGGFSAPVSSVPTINGPVIAGSNVVVTGTSAEAAGTTINLNVYADATTTTVASGPFTGTVTANGTWSTTATTLATGQYLGATATASGKSVSGESSRVLVRSGAKQVSECTVAPDEFRRDGKNYSIKITPLNPYTGLISNITIRLYTGSPGSLTLYASTNPTENSATSNRVTALTYSNPNFILEGANANVWGNTVYYVTAQINGQCESEIGVDSNTRTNAPVITSTSILSSLTQNINGTSTEANGTEIYVYRNSDDFLIGTTTVSGNAWTATISEVFQGDEIYARAKKTTTGSLISSISNIEFVGNQTLPPVITGQYTSASTSISGYTQGGGHTVRVFLNGTQIGTVNSNAFGAWTLVLSSLSPSVTLNPGDTLTADAQAPEESRSELSNSVTVASTTSPPAAPTVTGPIEAGNETINATGTSGTVHFYADGEFIGSTTGSSITLSTASATLYILKGVEITATNTNNGLTSALSNPVVVEASSTPAGITISSTPFNPIAGSSAQVLATVTDAFGSTMANQSVTFSIVTGNGTLSGSNPVNTDAFGVARISYLTPTTVELATVSASTGALSDQENIQSVAGSASLTNSTLSASPSTIAADGSSTSTITVQLIDSYGNSLDRDDGTVLLATDLGTLSSVTNNGDGTYTATLTSTNTGIATITATLNGNALTNSTTITITTVQASKFVITGSPTQTSSTSQTITITAYDSGGNIYPSYTGTKNLIFTGANPSLVGTNPTVSGTDFGTSTVITFTSGVATATMVLYKAETAVISVTDGNISTTGNDRLSVVVSPDIAYKLAITAVNPTSPIREIPRTSVTVELQDAQGNPVVASGNVSVTLSSNLSFEQYDGDTSTSTLIATPGTIISAGQSTATISYLKFTQSTRDGSAIYQPTANFTASSTGLQSSTSSNFRVIDGVLWEPTSSGGWKAVAWRVSNDGGTTWENGPNPIPILFTDQEIIQIPSGISISLDDNISIYNAIVYGSLDIPSTYSLNLKQSAFDVTTAGILVEGFLENTGGTFVNEDTSKPIVFSGGVYKHARDGGSIPKATWQTRSSTDSEIRVSGITSTALSSGLDQDFQRFLWHNTGQSVSQALHGNVTVSSHFDISTSTLSIGTHTLSISGTLDHSPSGWLQGTSSSTLIITGTGKIQFDNTSAAHQTVGTFSLNNGSGLILNSNLVVENQMVLTAGVITVSNDNHKLSYKGLNPITHTSGYVLGKLERIFPVTVTTPSFFYPIGSIEGYAPATLVFTSGTINANTEIVARTYVDDQNGINSRPNGSGLKGNKQVGRYWLVEPAQSLNSVEYSLALDIPSSEISTFTESSIVVKKLTRGNSKWKSPRGINRSSSGSRRVFEGYGFNDFSEFYLGEEESADPTKTTVTASPSSIIADGTTSSTITVQLKDSNGNNVAQGGASVVLSTTLGSISTVIDNNDGTYSASVTSTITGSATITGTLNGVSITESATLTVNPGAISTDPTGSLLSGTNLTRQADGTESATISVQLRDAQGNDIAQSGVSVSFTTTGGSLSASSATTDASGLATVTLSSTTAGSVQVNASIGGNAVQNGSPVTVTFTASTPTQISVYTGDGQSATVGTSVTTPPSVIVLDAGNNPVAGVNVTFAVALGGGSVTGASATTDASGIATVSSWTLGTTTGLNTLSATITGSSPEISTTITATATVGAPAQLVLQTPASGAASGSAFTTQPILEIRDAYGNLTNSSASVTMSVSTGATVVGTSTITASSGVASYSTAGIAGLVGTYTLTYSSDGLASAMQTISLTPGAISTDPTGSLLSGTNLTRQADGTESATISVQLRDAQGNDIAQSGVSVSFTTTGGSLSASSATTDASGLATVTLSSTTAGSVQVNASIGGNAVQNGSPVTVTFTASIATANRLVITGSSTQLAGTSQTITITAYDSNGNLATGYAGLKNLIFTGASNSPGGTIPSVATSSFGTGTSISFSSGVATASMILYTAETALIAATDGVINTATNDRLSVTVSAATVSTLSSSLSANPTTLIADGSSTSTITISLEDNFGNNIVGTTSSVLLTVNLGSLSPVSSLGNGSYTSIYTSGTRSGTAIIVASINGQILQQTASITLNARPVPARIDILEGDGQTGRVATSLSVAPKVIVRDENNLPIAGVTVIFSTLNLNGLPSSVSASTTQNGTIAQAWTLGTIAGQQTLSAHVAGSSPTLSVTFTAMALPGNPSQLEITSSEVDLAAGQRRALRIDVLDAYDNLVTTDNDRPILVEQVQGSGSVLGLSTLSSQNGQAALDVVGDKIGPLVLKASSTGLESDSTAFLVVLGDARILTIVSGNSQTGVVASALSIQLSVRLTDAQNNPVSGVLVSPRIGSGDGSISGNQAVTNGDGLAIIGTWTLGTKAGEQTLIASVAASNPANSVTFVAIAEPRPPSKILVTPVDDLISGETETINLEVVDDQNNPITTDDGRTITIEQTSGTGSITAPPSVTTQKGMASVTFTAKNIGIVVLKASSDGLTPAEVSFTIGVGNASKITIVEGNLQTAPINTSVPIRPSVRLTDANDHPIPGVVIQFSVGSGSGSVTGASALTNSEGVATVGLWTLGSSPGEQTLVASLLGSIPALSVVITANANPSTTPSIQIFAGDGQSAKVASAVAIPPSVLVKDAYNQALEGVDIFFSIQSGGGSIKPVSMVKTDNDGVARLAEWVLGTTVGTNTLRAGFAQGLSAESVRFTATGTVGSPEKITVIAPTYQSPPTPASNLVQLPRALVTDAYDNPIPNVSVAFSISGGGGSIEPSVAVSESDGSAWVTKWTMGTTVGVNTMIASIVGTSISSSYSLNTVASEVQRLSIVSGNEQIGLIGSSTKEELIVKAFDSYNNAVPNMILSWNITNQPQGSKNAGFKLKVSDSETQAQMSTTTDSTGTSKIVFVYGSLAGNYDIKSKLKDISGINDVLFTLTARPEQLSIDPNYPNPTPGDTFIPLNVPTNSRVTMEIFDVIGRKVRTLVQDQDLSAGRHIIALNRKDLASGTYIARVIALSQDGSVQKISKIFSIVNY